MGKLDRELLEHLQKAKEEMVMATGCLVQEEFFDVELAQKIKYVKEHIDSILLKRQGGGVA